MEYYSVLGVNTDASDSEIRRAYRKLAMVCSAYILSHSARLGEFNLGIFSVFLSFDCLFIFWGLRY